jgi:HSP20 family protein
MTQYAADIFAEFDRIKVRMTQVWQQALGPPGAPRFCPPMLEPAVDVYDTDDQVVVLVELSGIADQEVEISVEGRVFTLRGERLARQGHPGRLYSQMEICFGPFERVLTLPAEVDADGARASYLDGFLEITLPKARRQVSRQVRVTLP